MREAGGGLFDEKMKGERWREGKPRANRDKSTTCDGKYKRRRGERCGRREKNTYMYMLSFICTIVVHVA